MKKTAIFCTLMILWLFSSAQNPITNPMPNWLCNYWPGPVPPANESNTYTLTSTHTYGICNYNTLSDVYRFTLGEHETIYGIAIGMTAICGRNIISHIQPDRSFVYELETDTIHFHAHDTLTCYDSYNDIINHSPSRTLVCHLNSPVDYWMQLPDNYPFTPQLGITSIPIYEYYFDTPWTVKDSCYIGILHSSAKQAKNLYEAPSWGYRWGEYYCDTSTMDAVQDIGIVFSTSHNYHLRQNDNGSWSVETHNCQPLLFPIIAPHGSVNLDQAQPEATIINIVPNPATTTVLIKSNQTLLSIEVFDLSGRQILCKNACGSETTLNISSWPMGVYTLRLTTPNGNTLKRIIKNRQKQ